MMEHSSDMFASMFGVGAIPLLIMIWPLWRIFRRAGLAPAWSLLIFVPVLGWLASTALLAFARWPATEGRPNEQDAAP
ncbi:MAG: hypothetical protein V3R85_05535 [Alphaproteobacteria bacterium]